MAASSNPKSTAAAVAEGEEQAADKQQSVGSGDSVEVEVKGPDGKRLTTLNDDVAHPGYVREGDTPHDTLLTSEHASSVTPDKATAAREGFGVVNAVIPIPDPSGITQARQRQAEANKGGVRVERYEQTAPNGKVVTVEHDIDLGTTKIVSGS